MAEDLIIPWREVRPYDRVLFEGELITHEGIDLYDRPWGDGTTRLFADVRHRIWNGGTCVAERQADDLTAVRRASPVEPWNNDKPHRCPWCHAIAIDMERPSRWRVYQCCTCHVRFTRHPRLARWLPSAGVRCSEHIKEENGCD